MAFDWLQFFNNNHIEYSDSGKNVSKGHVVIRCPWCGGSDSGQHLSVNLDGAGYRCFRNPAQHRGKNPTFLIAKLTGLSMASAAQIAGTQISLPTDFMARVNGLLRPEPKRDSHRILKMPQEFRPFSSLPSCRPYRNHLIKERGIHPDDVDTLTKQFDLRYCTRGPFSGRIIFPITYEGSLVNWTGRTISRNATLRYRTLTDDEEKAEESGTDQAIGPITDYLLWYDQLLDVDADTLYICEGPFDALKVWYLGQREGIVGTALFTIDLSSSQIDLLHELLPQFRNRIMMLDRKTLHVAMRLRSRLSGLGVSIEQVPAGFKDPGELDHVRHLRPRRTR